MLLRSFLGLVASLTLWGTFFPVPYTDIRPHGSFVERVTGAIRASFFLTGAYEFVLIANSKAAGAFQHERPGSFAGFSGLPRLPSNAYLDGMYCNSSSWVFIPSVGTVASPNTCFSRDMYSGSSSEIGLAVEPVEPSRVAIGGVEMDDAAQSAKSSSFLLDIAYTREDQVLSFGRLFVPSPEVAKHFVMTSGLTVTTNMSNDVALMPISDAYEVVTAMIESSIGMGQSGVNPIYCRENGPVFTDSVAVCDVPLSSPALVTGSQLVEYSFHPGVGVVISRLARQQIGTPVNWSNCIAADSDAIPVKRVNNERGSISLLPASVASVRMPQLTALVLRRLENISHFVLLRLVFVIVANAGDGQTAAENRSSTDKEEGPSERPKRNRMGQRQRRRLHQREMRKQQAELIDRLEMESDGGSNPPPQAPPAPIPASPVGHAASSTVAPMAPIRPAMPVNQQGQGNGFRPPHHIHLPTFGNSR
ncbi:predicted protein [Histoplasma mississippiense (nom. inval.)]|uniref:predicted protein n=1 Tax=Ajellomyces capsulatus (strain NAm1 / WU24) TaxID=2059318 RepID=UPI000157CD51|nr:predicted protein [Histoplasma mississippiense (nom. inval.)]EDN10371.1 predicted protein [Histoplasma mississippiense (nom. inval.)]